MAVNFARLPELLALEKSERIFDGEHDPSSLKPAARTPVQPAQTPSALVAAVGPLREDALEPHGAGVAEEPHESRGRHSVNKSIFIGTIFKRAC